GPGAQGSAPRGFQPALPPRHRRAGGHLAPARVASRRGSPSDRCAGSGDRREGGAEALAVTEEEKTEQEDQQEPEAPAEEPAAEGAPEASTEEAAPEAA